MAMWLEFSRDNAKRRFYFDVPPGMEEIIREGGDVLGEKEREFEELTVSFFFSGILRSLTLKIDKNWTERLRNRHVG